MNLLKEGINNKSVIKTESKKRLVIDNNPMEYPIYKIRLDNLYYNDKNDRIATWISEYKQEKNIDEFDKSNIDEYNDIIHNFITQNNPDKIKKTQNNIKLIGQQEVGVVLSDGRIIDGNRRFTCLRNIEKENSKTEYFQAVILEHSIEHNAKQIKMLELMLQHGVDEKVEYTPIDRLVGIYNDLIDTKLLTLEEYVQSTNWSKSEVELEVEKAKLMIEFLEFNGTPKKFYIARTLGIADPLKELQAMLKKITNEDERENLKNTVFAQLIKEPYGDMTRYMRDVKKIATSKFLPDYLEANREFVEKVCDEVEEKMNVAKEIAKDKSSIEDKMSEIRKDDYTSKEMYKTMEKFKNIVNSDSTRNQPLKQLEKAYDTLELVDTNIFNKLNNEQKIDMIKQIEEIQEIILEIRGRLDV